jgi:hypothetical protein
VARQLTRGMGSLDGVLLQGVLVVTGRPVARTRTRFGSGTLSVSSVKRPATTRRTTRSSALRRSTRRKSPRALRAGVARLTKAHAGVTGPFAVSPRAPLGSPQPHGEGAEASRDGVGKSAAEHDQLHLGISPATSSRPSAHVYPSSPPPPPRPCTEARTAHVKPRRARVGHGRFSSRGPALRDRAVTPGPSSAQAVPEVETAASGPPWSSSWRPEWHTEPSRRELHRYVP